MKKKLPSIISRTFVMWKSIKRIDIKHDHYSISSNGEIINNYNKEILQQFRYKNRIHSFVLLERLDGTFIQCNVTLLMMQSFVCEDYCSRHEFYFKNGDYTDLYIRNIGVCKTSVMTLPDKEIHIICKLLEIGTSTEDICNIYNYIRKDIMKRFVNNIRFGKIKREIADCYQI